MKLPPMLKRQAQLFEVLISKIGVLSLMLEESKEKLKLKSIPSGVGGNGRNDATTMILFLFTLAFNSFDLFCNADSNCNEYLFELTSISSSIINKRILKEQPNSMSIWYKW